MQGIKENKHAHSINGLSFANDFVDLFKATLESCQPIFNILEEFEHLSGLKVNKNRT